MTKNRPAKAAAQPVPSGVTRSNHESVWDEKAHEEQRRRILATYFQVTRLAALVCSNSSLEEEIVRITSDLHELYSNEVAALSKYSVARSKLMDLGAQLPKLSHGRLPLGLPNPAEEISRAIHPCS